MNREFVLAILYDLTLTIGSEVHLTPLLGRFLQRLLYHTGFPAGAVFVERQPGPTAATARLAAAIGDHGLGQRLGQRIELAADVFDGEAELVADTATAAALGCSRGYAYRLRLPVDAGSAILLFSPTPPDHSLPLTEVFSPVLRNLAHAIVLCRSHEAETRTLASDRDRARSDLLATLKQVEQQRALLRNLMDNIPDLVWLKDGDGVYLACNPRFERLYGASEADIIGKTDYDFVPAEQADFFRAKDREALAAGRPTANEEWLTFADDGYRGLFETTKTAMRAADGSLIGVLGIAHDISERKAAEERIHHLAHHDLLTGLLNRFSFQERTRMAMATARRNRNMLAVLLIDIDHFKLVNDSLGHQFGDLLLKEVAIRLRSAVRESDIVSRFGGDEFVIVLTGVETPEAAASAAGKILRTIDQPFAVPGRVLQSTASIGIALFPADGDDVDALIKNADIAMYQVKNKGRNGFEFFSPHMTETALEHLELERELRVAIAERQLCLHYQPQVRKGDRHPCSVEALVRWQHPERDMVYPDHFIALAEEFGLIESIGDWVLDDACRQLAAWRAAGVGDLRVAVNISARQLRSADLARRVGELLARHGIPPEALELEVTESTAMTNPERAIGQLVALRELGVSLAIDDFGTGYSSLAYLQRLPIQRLKVDRTFVQDIESDQNDAAICAGTIALAHNLGLEVIAEGVETAAQERFLIEHGCDYLQGYLYSRPLPAEQLTSVLLADGD